jgi:hypothetical protein
VSGGCSKATLVYGIGVLVAPCQSCAMDDQGQVHSQATSSQWSHAKKATGQYSIAAAEREVDPMSHRVELEWYEVHAGNRILDMRRIARVLFPHDPEDPGVFWLPFDVLDKNGDPDPKLSVELTNYWARARGDFHAKISGVQGVRSFFTGNGSILPSGGAYVRNGIGQEDGRRGTIEYLETRDIPIEVGAEVFEVPEGEFHEKGKPFAYGGIGQELTLPYDVWVNGSYVDEGGYVRVAERRTLDIWQAGFKNPGSNTVANPMTQSIIDSGYDYIGPMKDISGIVEGIVKYKLATLTHNGKIQFLRELGYGKDDKAPASYHEMGLRPINYFLRHMDEYVKERIIQVPLDDKNRKRFFEEGSIVEVSRDPYRGNPNVHLTKLRVQGIEAMVLPDVEVRWNPKHATGIPLAEMEAIRALNPRLADAIEESGKTDADAWRDLAQCYLGHVVHGEGPAAEIIDLSDDEIDPKYRKTMRRIVEAAKDKARKGGSVNVDAHAREIIEQMSRDESISDKCIGYVIRGEIYFIPKASTIRYFAVSGGEVPGLKGDQEVELANMGKPYAAAIVSLSSVGTNEEHLVGTLEGYIESLRKVANNPGLAKHLTTTVPGKKIGKSFNIRGNHAVPGTFFYHPEVEANSIGYVNHAPYTDPATWDPGRGKEGDKDFRRSSAIRAASRKEVIALGLDPDIPHLGWMLAAGNAAEIDAGIMDWITDTNAGPATQIGNEWFDREGRKLSDEEFWLEQAKRRVLLGAGDPGEDRLRAMTTEDLKRLLRGKLVGITPTRLEDVVKALNEGQDIIQKVGPAFKRTIANTWAIEREDPAHAVMQKLHGAVYAMTQRPTPVDPAMNKLLGLMRIGTEGYSIEANPQFLSTKKGYSAIYDAAPRLVMELLRERPNLKELLGKETTPEERQLSKFTPEDAGILLGYSGDERSQAKVAAMFRRASEGKVTSSVAWAKLQAEWTQHVSQNNAVNTPLIKVLGAHAFNNMRMLADRELESLARWMSWMSQSIEPEQREEKREEYAASFFHGNPGALESARTTSGRMRDMQVLTGNALS